MLKFTQIAGGINQPLVSVVMVVRNVSQFLAEAIESILAQTFTDFEFIILDFGSTDRSKAIASDYAARDNRIRLHEIPIAGLVPARNAACSLAKGQYIAIQDADDISMPERLRWEVEFMQKHPDFGLIGGAAQWVDAQARPLWTLEFPTSDREIKLALTTRCPFSHTAVLMRRDAFVAVGGYRAAFTASHDYDLFLRISEHFHCANLNQAVVKYRLHPDQISVGKRRHQTLCVAAARASAAFRKNGNPDPLDSVDTITPNLLTDLGVSPVDLQVTLFLDYRDWITNMMRANQYPMALEIAAEVLQSDWEYVERREIGYLQRILAKLYWRTRLFRKSFLAAYCGVRLGIDKHFGEKLLRRIRQLARA